VAGLIAMIFRLSQKLNAKIKAGTRRGPGSVFRVGVAGDRAATKHHGDELVSAIICLGHH